MGLTPPSTISSCVFSAIESVWEFYYLSCDKSIKLHCLSCELGLLPTVEATLFVWSGSSCSHNITHTTLCLISTAWNTSFSSPILFNTYTQSCIKWTNQTSCSVYNGAGLGAEEIHTYTFATIFEHGVYVLVSTNIGRKLSYKGFPVNDSLP